MTLRIHGFHTRYEIDKDGKASDTMFIYIRLPTSEAERYLNRENDLMRKSMTFTSALGTEYFQLTEIKFLEYENPKRVSIYEKIMVYTAKFTKMEMLYSSGHYNGIRPVMNEDIEVIP